MKKLVATLALVVAAPFGAAMAADMPVKAVPLAPPCAANDIVRANNLVAADAVQEWSRYWEVTSFAPVPFLFDQEVGTSVLGAGVHGAVMGDWLGMCHLYVYGEYWQVQGSTSYFSPGPGILVNQDGDKVYHGDMRVGKGFDWGSNAMITPYIGFGAHEWNRNLVGPGGYNEDYRHEYVGAGVLFQYIFTPRVVFGWWGLAGTTVNPHMTTSLNGGAPINPYTYTLGTAPIYMLGFSLDYAFAPHWHAIASVEGTKYQYLQSAPSPIDGSLEPTSQTYQAVFKLGIGYSWWDDVVVARY